MERSNGLVVRPRSLKGEVIDAYPVLQSDVRGLHEDEDARLIQDLYDAQRVVVTSDRYQQVTWNGITAYLRPGENVVPKPFWDILAQNRRDVDEANRNLARDIARYRRGPKRRVINVTRTTTEDRSERRIADNEHRLIEGSAGRTEEEKASIG